MDEVFARFRAANLRIHPAKCHWAVNRVKFLVHVFDDRGISIDREKFSVVENFPVPTTVKGVRSFLGLANYWRRFLKNFSQTSAPLRNLLKTGVPFEWTQECQTALEQIKRSLITAPVLRLPRFQDGFILTTDASYKGISYILSQRDENGKEDPVAYGGRGLRPNETRWPVTHLEALAVISGVKQFHPYLAGKEFQIYTDHLTLTFLRRMKIAENNRLARWALFLQPYEFTIHYKKGAKLTAADAISRLDNLPPPADEWEAEDDMVCAVSTTPGGGGCISNLGRPSRE
jgi:hypothetical protein